MCGADPAGRPTAFRASAGAGRQAGKGQPMTERRKGRPGALSVDAGRPADTTDSGRAGLVRCRSGGQSHCVLCCCRFERRCGNGTPGRSDVRATLGRCQWTLGGLWTQQRAGGPLLCGADPAGSPTAFCAPAGPGARPGRTAQEGATKGPPWRFVSGRWEACGHNREREGHCCAVPIRRVNPLLSVRLPGQAASRGGQPMTERRKGRPGALSVDAGRPADTTDSGRAGLVRCRSGGQSHCFLCCLPGRAPSRGGQPMTERRKGRPGALSVDAGRPADTTDSGRAGLVRCRSGGQSHCVLCCCRFERRCGNGTPGRSDVRATLWDALSVDAGRPVDTIREREGHCCAVPIRRAGPLLSVLLPGRAPGQEGQPRTERRKGRPGALSVDAGRPADTTDSGRAGLVRCRSGGQSHCFLCCCRAGRRSRKGQPRPERRKGRPGALSVNAGRPVDTAESGRAIVVRCRSGGQAHCFLCCCRAGRQAGKDSPGRSDERAALALCQWTLGGPPTPQTAAGPGLSGADPAGSPTASCAAAGSGRRSREGQPRTERRKGRPGALSVDAGRPADTTGQRQGRACPVPIRRAGPLLSVLLPGRAPSREGQPMTERRKGRPGALSVDAGRPADTTDSGRAGLVRCRSGGQSHCFLCCCRAGRRSRKGQPRTERRKGRPGALSVNAGRPVDTTESGRAIVVRCRSGGQSHCFLCCCRAGRQAGKDSP